MKNKLKITILRVLARVPSNFALRENVLRSDVSLETVTPPTKLDVDQALGELEALGYIVGTTNELTGDRKYVITDLGKLELGKI